MTFGEKVISFHERLHYTGAPLPPGIRVMNPFVESPQAMNNLRSFAGRYLNDHRSRHIILGINPGRHGAGVTGIPFTDTKRLTSEFGIPHEGKTTHEISSIFIYDVIRAYGGIEAFYRNFYINSPCPLGFTVTNGDGKEKNYNYYDSPALLQAVREFVVDSLYRLIDLGINTDACFCLGTGENARFLNKLNEQYSFFEEIIPLEHPRYIMQYKSASKELYIDKYVNSLNSVSNRIKKPTNAHKN